MDNDIPMEDDGEQQEGVIEDLRKALQALRSHLGEEHAATKDMLARFRKAREERDASKPLDAQIINLGRGVGNCMANSWRRRRRSRPRSSRSQQPPLSSVPSRKCKRQRGTSLRAPTPTSTS